jgi:hypothetical protein
LHEVGQGHLKQKQGAEQLRMSEDSASSAEIQGPGRARQRFRQVFASRPNAENRVVTQLLVIVQLFVTRREKQIRCANISARECSTSVRSPPSGKHCAGRPFGLIKPFGASNPKRPFA